MSEPGGEEIAAAYRPVAKALGLGIPTESCGRTADHDKHLWGLAAIPHGYPTDGWRCCPGVPMSTMFEERFEGHVWIGEEHWEFTSTPQTNPTVMPTHVAAKLTARRRLPVPAMRRAIRLDAGLTQSDVAESVGVQRETVARWEAGVRNPRGDTLLAYVELLDELRTVTGHG